LAKSIETRLGFSVTASHAVSHVAVKSTLSQARCISFGPIQASASAERAGVNHRRPGLRCRRRAACSRAIRP
jgi:hypothetical protein